MVVDLLLDVQPFAAAVAERLVHHRLLAAPHLLGVEVAQVLRRLVRGGQLAAARAKQALKDLADMPLRRYPHAPLLTRMFALRDNVTAYDAAYLAFAEELAVPLLTRDAALSAVPGCCAKVEVL